MILADKIMQLRKKNGWSQEELAGRLGVSRQSISKWESAMSVPELDKILQMSQIFEVSTDFLLKDDQSTEDYVPGNPDGSPDEQPMRKVTLEEAQEFLRLQSETAPRISLGVSMCILSPLLLILLPYLASQGFLPISESLAVAFSLTVLLLMVSGAVVLFIFCDMQSNRYEFLEKEDFQLEYGISGMVSEKLEADRKSFTQHIAVGVSLCILGTVPLLFTSIMSTEWGAFPVLLSTCVLLILVSIAVPLFILAEMRNEACCKLLQSGDFTPQKKRANKTLSAFYWPVIVALYLGISFYTGGWHYTWIIWPVAGILSAFLANLIELFRR